MPSRKRHLRREAWGRYNDRKYTLKKGSRSTYNTENEPPPYTIYDWPYERQPDDIEIGQMAWAEEQARLRLDDERQPGDTEALYDDERQPDADELEADDDQPELDQELESESSASEDEIEKPTGQDEEKMIIELGNIAISHGMTEACLKDVIKWLRDFSPQVCLLRTTQYSLT